MTRAMLVVILILFSVSSVNFVDSLIQESLGKFLGTFATSVKQCIPTVHIIVIIYAKKSFVCSAFYNAMWLFFSRVRIPELLNQLCNDSQGSNALRRDACYGCFYRASILPQSYSMLIAMSTCANDYLNNTNYGHCQAYLRVCAREKFNRLFIISQ